MIGVLATALILQPAPTQPAESFEQAVAARRAGDNDRAIEILEQMLAEAAKLGASNKRTLEEAVPAPVAKVAKPAEVASPAAVAAASDEDDDEDEAYNPLAMATD